MKLVVGLGNPGRQYARTRHNIGYDVIDALACHLGWVRDTDGFNRQARANFHGLVLAGTVGLGDQEQKLLLLKPTTYMNLSGQSVQAAMAFYRIAPPEIMIVLDDMALPCGKIRLRSGGSSGGHNGLRDIERALGTADYPRLRIGIDAPPGQVPGKDYVLTRFTEEQQPLMASAVDRALDAIRRWMDVGIVQAMTEFN